MTDKNVQSLYHTVNYVTNTNDLKISLFNSVVLKMGSHNLYSHKQFCERFPRSQWNQKSVSGEIQNPKTLIAYMWNMET